MTTAAGTATWKIDPAHTLVEFAVRHLMISTVKGRFSQVEGTIEANPDDLTTARVRAEIDVASIDTREAQRDEHLRSADFFDVQNHPKIVFESSSVERAGDNRYKVHGTLTIRGVSRPITLDVTYTGRAKDPWGNERIGFTADASVDRRDFGLTWNAPLETGGVLVGHEVQIHLEVEAIKQS